LKKTKYSIIIPARNEQNSIANAINKVASALKGTAYEIIVAEDGSTDDTVKQAAKACKKLPNASLLHSEKRLGRGKAVCQAFAKAKGEVVAFIDADLSPGLDSLKPVLLQAERHGIAIGSRYLMQSRVERGAARSIASKAYNLLAKLLLGTKVSDHQCGLKAFRKSIALQLCQQCTQKGWSWDTEILAIAHENGFDIAEVPVNWKERKKGASKVKVARDAIRMFFELLRIAARPHAR